MLRPTLTKRQIATLRAAAGQAAKAGLWRLETTLLTLADEGECGMMTRARIGNEIQRLHEEAVRSDYILSGVRKGARR